MPKFDWKKEDKQFCVPAFTPTKTPGPTLSSPPGDKAVDYFNLFFDDHLVKSVVDFTNSNYKRSCDENKENTLDVIDRELRAYFGVKILIEILYKDRLEELWSSNRKWPLLEAVGLTNVFQRDRFTLLSRYLHFCNEEDALPQTHVNYDKLYKIRFLLKHLQQKFQAQYVPHQQVSVDECMVPFRG